MSTNLIIDLETLGTSDNAAILAIAITAYGENDVNKELTTLGCENTLFIKLNVQEQLDKYNRVIDPETIKWWKNQGEEAQFILAPSKHDTSVLKIADQISQFCQKHNYTDGFIWQRGNKDIAWLDSLFKSIGKESPLKWWKVRDIRTAIDIKCGTPYGNLPHEHQDKFFDEFPEFVAHNPTHDILKDIYNLRFIKIL